MIPCCHILWRGGTPCPHMTKGTKWQRRNRDESLLELIPSMKEEPPGPNHPPLTALPLNALGVKFQHMSLDRHIHSCQQPLQITGWFQILWVLWKGGPFQAVYQCSSSPCPWRTLLPGPSLCPYLSTSASPSSCLSLCSRHCARHWGHGDEPWKIPAPETLESGFMGSLLNDWIND